MKRKIICILTIFTVFLVSSFTKDFTPLFYDYGGKTCRVQRYYINITGHPQSLQFIDSRDTEQHFEGSYSVQYMYIFEKEDNNYYHFQKYLSKAMPGNNLSATYTPVGRWIKITKDWSAYIDSDGKSHRLYKK